MTPATQASAIYIPQLAISLFWSPVIPVIEVFDIGFVSQPQNIIFLRRMSNIPLYCTLERRDTSVKCAGDISHLIPHLEVNTGKCSHRNSKANYIHRMYCSYTPGTGTRGSDRSPLIFFRTDHGKSKVLYCMYINHEEKISPVVQVTHV